MVGNSHIMHVAWSHILVVLLGLVWERTVGKFILQVTEESFDGIARIDNLDVRMTECLSGWYLRGMLGVLVFGP